MKRITRLIQPQLLPTPTLRSALLTALAATALGAVGIAYQDAPKVEKKRTVTVQSLGEGHTLSIKGEGDIQVKPDEKEPLVLAPGARMRIAEKKDGQSRKLEVTPEKKVYTVDGQEKPFDADAEAWLRDTLKASEQAKADAKARGEEAKHRRIEVEVKEDGTQRHVIRKENGEVVEDVLVEVPEVKLTQEGPGKQRLIVKKGGKVVEERLIEHPEVQIVEGSEGGRRIVIKKAGKVVSEEELPDVKVTHDKGQQHIIVKKGGKVVEDRIIEVPEVKVTEETDGSQRITVKKGGKVVEEHRVPGAQAHVMRFKTRGGDPVIVDSEGGPDFFWETDDSEGPGSFSGRTPHPGEFRRMSPPDVQQLRRQVDELKKQVAELQRQLGRPAAAPKAPKPTPAPAPAPAPKPAN